MYLGLYTLCGICLVIAVIAGLLALRIGNIGRKQLILLYRYHNAYVHADHSILFFAAAENKLLDTYSNLDHQLRNLSAQLQKLIDLDVIPAGDRNTAQRQLELLQTALGQHKDRFQYLDTGEE